MASLLEKYGLLKTTRVIQGFYEDVLADPRLAHLFDRVTITELAELQTRFLNMVMGGRSRQAADHVDEERTLQVDEAGLEEVISHLETRLQKGGFEEQDVDYIVGVYRKHGPLAMGQA